MTQLATGIFVKAKLIKDLGNLAAHSHKPLTPTTYSYDAAGNLSGYAYPNTVQTANAFDTLNRLTQTCEATTLSWLE